MSFKTSPMTGFELQASGVGSDHSANRATTKKCPQLNFIFFFSEVTLHRRQQLTRSYSEKQRYDGWYNNLAHPKWGTVGKSSVTLQTSTHNRI